MLIENSTPPTYSLRGGGGKGKRTIRSLEGEAFLRLSIPFEGAYNRKEGKSQILRSPPSKYCKREEEGGLRGVFSSRDFKGGCAFTCFKKGKKNLLANSSFGMALLKEEKSSWRE